MRLRWKEPTGAERDPQGAIETLFERAAAEPRLFARVLDAFYGGERDEKTLSRL